ncbi:amidase [Fusarium pseudoanthophilum]|uniref:Amidase n=1 Tax=Fusarium pseudoanthophilum TaxID=48495 RepID=A0A8H5P6X4_9HYPO|nr:amidase [Fusarium pseudoanthophilum]
MLVQPYQLSATDVAAKIRDGQLTVEEYAQSLLGRIKERDPIVKAWAYLNPDQVLEQARKLDAVPTEERGPLHGVAIAVKDVIYTKDMPTQFNSPIYKDDAPQVDAASIIILRKAGALILGKTTTTEFAATTQGPQTTNPHDSSRTPGGSSSGSGAVVADFQAPISLGTQTGGSTIRPASFNGIYGFKPTWNSISREGQKVFSLILDTIGIYARTVEDLNLLADVFALEDDEPPNQEYLIKHLKLGVSVTMVWPEASRSLNRAMAKAVQLLRENGAIVKDVNFPQYLQDLPKWHSVVFNTDGRTAFLPEYRVDKSQIADQLVGHVENRLKISRAEQIKAFDEIAAARPIVDEMLGKYDAVLVPSVPDEAPKGIEATGSAAFNLIWTALHTPVINIPGFAGENGMPIGLSLVAPRYHDRKLLAVSKAVGKLFEASGGWKSQIV